MTEGRRDYGLPPLDEWGNPRCPLEVIEWEQEHRQMHRHPCGAEMYVEWSFVVPIGPGQTVTPADVSTDAVSSGWEVTCTNGHTLRFSSNGLSATDDAEPCDFDLLFPAAPSGSNKQANQ